MAYLKTIEHPGTDGPEFAFVNDLSDLPNDVTSILIDRKAKNKQKLSEHQQIERLRIGDFGDDTASLVSKLKKLSYLELSSLRVSPTTLNSASLKILVIDTAPAVSNFDFIGNCPKLESIAAVGCLKLNSIAGLPSKLKELDIRGAPTSTGKLNSLDLLMSLNKLEYLTLATKIQSKSIMPIAELKKLEYLWLQNRYKKDAYEAILKSNKKLASIELHNGTFTRKHGFVKYVD